MKRAATVSVLVLLSVLWLWPLPAPAELSPLGVQILDRNGRVLYQALDPVRGGSRPVRLSEVAPSLVAATIAVEDASFATNPGIDVGASLRALSQNVAAGEVVAGGSTITQQLARLRYLPPDERAERSVQRKLLEAWLAVRLTGTLGKDGVLEAYLNSAPYGNLAIGAEAAAWTYFGKPARELSLAESALLGGLPQSPSDYDPFAHVEAGQARQAEVLGLMARHGAISEDEAQAAKAEPLQLNARPFPLAAGHFVDFVRGLVPTGAVRVWTTLDADTQAFAEGAAARQVGRLAEHDVGDAAVVVLDPATGDVRAMVGGVDYFDQTDAAQVNMATTPRQPGSSFKPIVYAAALESGRFNLASVLRDERSVFLTRLGERYVPENYDRQFHGPVPLRVALASSFNVPAVAVLNEVGLPPVIGLAHDLGLPVPDDADLSMALGADEVRLLDLTAAYGAFASGGVFRQPRLIVRAEDALGRPVGEWQSDAGRRVMSEQTAWLIGDVLSDDFARAPGFGRDGVLHVPGQHVSVKTGTTTDFRDNWTVGYTSHVVVGVWVGNPDNRAMRDVSGVSGAAPLWREVLDSVIDDTLAPRVPPGLQQVSLCARSAQLAGPWCAERRLEWLPPGAELVPVVAQPGVRILYPDPGAVFVLDAEVPSAVPIEVSSVDGAVDVLLDGELLGTCDGSCVLAWPPSAGRHVIAVGQQSAAIEVVPSRQEPPSP